MARPLAYEPKYALNAICPYFTMFPLEYPFRVLRNHKKENPVVLDPFCGRGTTVYAARKMGLSAWGLDTSPIAVAIAKAKLATAKLDEILDLANDLIRREPQHIPKTEFFKYGYSAQTLRELCSLREGLLEIEEESGASALLRAAALGCLHGPLSKTMEGAGSFSNQMPRTFSSKPSYSVEFWKKRNLTAPKIKIIKVLKRKLSRIQDLENEIAGSPNQIICGDARNRNIYHYLPENTSVVITSPPYYGMRTYVEDQWLRMWFLGGPEVIEYGNKNQIDHNGQLNFIQDLAKVWSNISTLSKSDRLDLYVRFGTVPSIKSDAQRLMKDSLEASGGWKMVSVRSAKDANAGKRQAHMMATKSKATQEFDFHAVRI